jgi:hypothetical protein
LIRIEPEGPQQFCARGDLFLCDIDLNRRRSLGMDALVVSARWIVMAVAGAALRRWTPGWRARILNRY